MLVYFYHGQLVGPLFKAQKSSQALNMASQNDQKPFSEVGETKIVLSGTFTGARM